MSFIYSLKITTNAILQIFLLGFSGYLLTRRKLTSAENLKFLSWATIILFFPCFIFAKLIENFNFQVYSNWWIFPLMSFVVTLVGILTGVLFVKLDKDLEKFKREFISLVTFQNSGYLPLILVAFLLPIESQEQVFIYIFLFLLGFNLIMWSVGVFYLRGKKERFELSSLLSPPVIAVLAALFIISLGWANSIPQFLIRPVKMFGECALPLAMLVVGGNLAQIDFKLQESLKQVVYLVVAKLVFLPLLFFGIIFLIKPVYEIAFLILLQSIMPSATSLGVIMRNYDKKDNIISLGIFWTHVLSLLTIPLFLILFSALSAFLIR
ncbi:MAG: AEC family transporter [Candidatus Omnitrophica bacterium]|nr:AEC family transporter [Candidatus Omnitrophota bacterium]MDD5355398.1 AEC family transporter [Candidatus Omnitrophota bacterium]